MIISAAHLQRGAVLEDFAALPAYLPDAGIMMAFAVFPLPNLPWGFSGKDSKKEPVWQKSLRDVVPGPLPMCRQGKLRIAGTTTSPSSHHSREGPGSGTLAGSEQKGRCRRGKEEDFCEPAI